MTPVKPVARAQAKAKRPQDKRKTNKVSSRGPNYWPPLETAVMTRVKKLKKDINVKQLVTDSGMTYTTVMNTLKRLIRDGKITITGGPGRYRRYHLAA